MLALIVTAAGLLAAGTPPADPEPRPGADAPPAAAACQAPGRYETRWSPALLYRLGERLRATPLAQLPKPDEEKAVLRTVDGCSAPLVVAAGVGR